MMKDRKLRRLSEVNEYFLYEEGCFYKIR